MTEPNSEVVEYHNVLDDYTPEQREQAAQIKSGLHPSRGMKGYFQTSEEILAEFGRYYGWQAVLDASDGRIEAGTFVGLLAAARDSERKRRLDRLSDMKLVMDSLFSSKGQKALEKLANELDE